MIVTASLTTGHCTGNCYDASLRWELERRIMTVGELRKQLEGIDPKTNVALYRETDEGTEFFDVTDVSLSTGTTLRNEHTAYKAGFRFESTGLEKWLLISFEAA
jgi:hypothetical protein